MKFSKTMMDKIHFCQFCGNYGLTPTDAAELITIAKQVYNAKVAFANTGTDKTKKKSKKLEKSFEEKANVLGFGVSWNALWPTLTRGNMEIALPE